MKVFDEDIISKFDDLVGECTLKLSSLCVNTGIDEWFPIMYMGKQSGTIHLKSIWRPSVTSKAKAQSGAPAKINAMQQAQQKQQQTLQNQLTKEQMRVAEWACVVLQKNWRAYKARKEFN